MQRGLVVAALAAALALPGAAWPQGASGTHGVPVSAPAAALDSNTAPSTVPRRPFDHRWHERLACTSCHGSGAQHRTKLVHTPTDCARCHHDQDLGKQCVECHSRTGLPTNTRVTAPMAITARDTVEMRELPFGHDRHRALACRECHGTPVTLDRNRQCSACHDRHHRPEANCSTCHAGAIRAAHSVSVHLSCTGSGCHAASVAPAPTLSRGLCLVCHPEKRMHEPGGVCATCHKIPTPAAAQRAASAGQLPRGER